MDEIALALRETAAELGWTPTRLAVVVNKSEASARVWMKGTTEIGGPDLLTLLREMPGLRERLLPFTKAAKRVAA